MSSLRARVVRLEADRRLFRQEAERIATRLGVTVDEVMAGAEAVVRRVREMVDRGMTGTEVIAAYASDLGTTPGGLMRETGVTPESVMRMVR